MYKSGERNKSYPSCGDFFPSARARLGDLHFTGPRVGSSSFRVLVQGDSAAEVSYWTEVGAAGRFEGGNGAAEVVGGAIWGIRGGVAD